MILDDYDFLCEKQVLNASAYAKNGFNILSPRDWGHRAVPLNIQFLILGPHDKDLIIDIVVKKDANSAEEVIGTSGTIPKADLVRGKVFTLPVPPLDKKYQLITVKFRRDGVAPSTDPTTGDTCPTDQFLNSPADLPNGITAVFTHNFKTTVTYPFSNEDKIYSA